MTSVRRISTAAVTALFALLAGATSAFAQVPPDGGTGSGTGTVAPVTGGGTPTGTYILVAVAAAAFVALAVVTARSLRAHTRRSHVVRPA
jgi:hypothetical protein